MPLPVVQKDQALSQAHASLKAPLEPIEEGGGGFPGGKAIARLQVLAAEGCRGTGQLPGVGEGGVLPGGAGAGVAGDAGGGHAEGQRELT